MVYCKLYDQVGLYDPRDCMIHEMDLNLMILTDPYPRIRSRWFSTIFDACKILTTMVIIVRSSK